MSPYALDLPGGVQAQVVGIAEGMRARGHDAWVVGPGEARSGADAFTKIVGPVLRVPANRSKAPVSLSPRSIRRVREAVAGADVVHVHEPFMPVVSWAAMATDARLVLTFHADPSQLIRTVYRWGAPLLRKVVERADVVTAVSPVASSPLLRIGVRPLEIPNGVSLPNSAPTSESRGRQVVFLGRDEPRKGLDVLLKAWPHVVASVPDANLMVMGASRTRVPVGVVTVGAVEADRKWEILTASAVFCAPNLGGESFGITLVEGMAAGCAVVASDLPAFIHVLGGAGRVFPVGDAASLAQTLVEVLGDRDEANRLGDAGVARADDFSWERVLDAYESVYFDLS